MFLTQLDRHLNKTINNIWSSLKFHDRVSFISSLFFLGRFIIIKSLESFGLNMEQKIIVKGLMCVFLIKLKHTGVFV